MIYTLGFSYLTKTSINVMGGFPKSDTWVLTPDGHSSIYSRYVWTKTGIWTKDWIYTANV